MSKASGTRSTITVVLQGDSSSAISPQGAAADLAAGLSRAAPWAYFSEIQFYNNFSGHKFFFWCLVPLCLLIQRVPAVSWH